MHKRNYYATICVLYSYDIILLTIIRVDYGYRSTNREKHVLHQSVQHHNFVQHLLVPIGTWGYREKERCSAGLGRCFQQKCEKWDLIRENWKIKRFYQFPEIYDCIKISLFGLEFCLYWRYCCVTLERKGLN